MFFQISRRVLVLFGALLMAGCTLPSSPSAQTGGSRAGQGGPFRLGIDVLAANRFDLLRGKRVGLICNQTSVSGTGLHTRVLLQRAGVNLTALYAPEHGIDGTIKAGVHVSNRRDAVTGLTVYSLYGPTRKPTPAMLAPIDVLLFDLQDIGSRSYTYISTMALAMDACAETGKMFVVLDRPNPLGGLRVEGPPVEPQWKSFVSQINVPYVHGMTTGELAMMISGEGWCSARPNFRVVRMSGWNRNMVWNDTGLRWHRTSPNIPHANSPIYYVATGMLGGAAAVDVGIGTENPFGYAGGRGVNAAAFAAHCRRLGFPGVSFTPYSRNGFGGVRLGINPRAGANITALDVYLIAELNRLSKGAVLGKMSASQISLFNKVYGSDSLRRDLMRGVSPGRIVGSWSGFENSFRSKRQRYLLY
jgi:uncharacterized protein YbbC (DUF1343 family)